jgi:hypothetical protein
MAGCTWREHDGVRYLYVDYRGLDDEGGVPVLFEAARIVAEQDGPVRMLSDLTGARTGYQALSEAKRMAREVFDRRGTRVALLGLTGLQTMTLRGVKRLGQGRAFAAFQTMDEALAYLVGDEIRRT